MKFLWNRSGGGVFGLFIGQGNFRQHAVQLFMYRVPDFLQPLIPFQTVWWDLLHPYLFDNEDQVWLAWTQELFRVYWRGGPSWLARATEVVLRHCESFLPVICNGSLSCRNILCSRPQLLFFNLCILIPASHGTTRGSRCGGYLRTSWIWYEHWDPCFLLPGC